MNDKVLRFPCVEIIRTANTPQTALLHSGKLPTVTKTMKHVVMYCVIVRCKL